MQTQMDEFIFTSKFPDIKLPTGNFVKLIFKNIEKWENSPALVCGNSLKEISYKELQALTRKWCGFFTSKFKQGSVIVFIAPNCLEVCVGFLGTVAAGMVYLGIYGGCTVDEMKSQLQGVNPACIIYHQMYASKVKEAIAQLTALSMLEIIIGENMSEGDMYFKDISENSDVVPMNEIKLTGEECACIFFTSGTTGMPKATLISHNGLCAYMAIVAEKQRGVLDDQTDGKRQAVTFAHRNMGHSYGVIVILAGGIYQGNKIFVKDFEENRFLDDLQAFKVSKIHIVPYMVKTLLRIPKEKPSILEHLKFVLSGGVNISEQLEREFRETFPKLFLQQGYGLTELMVVGQDPIEGGKVGSSGAIINNVKIKVVDTETGKSLPANRSGEIYVKSPMAFLEYANMPEATALTKLPDGWVRTGDFGYVDEDGYIKMEARLKEIIKCGHFMPVYPAEIENVMQGYPGVKFVTVLGIPHEELGEIPRAFVVLEDESITGKELEEFVTKKMSEKNHLRGGVVILNELPKTLLGKVDKMKLKKMIFH